MAENGLLILGAPNAAPPAKKTQARKAPAKKAARKAAARKKPVKKPPKKAVGPHPQDLSTAQVAQLGFEVIDAPYAAYRLVVSGLPWREVAARTGYEDEGAAQLAVETMMRRAVAEQGPGNRALALSMSIARHESLMHAWWENATTELDPNAAAVVSRELAQLDKVQRVGEIDSQAGQGGPRIVIAGTEEQYVAMLREVYGEQQGQSRPALPPASNDTIDG